LLNWASAPEACFSGSPPEQIQSSLFPLYDRNPQTFVPNIFFAKPEDFHAATMTVEHGPQRASAVLLPIVAEK